MKITAVEVKPGMIIEYKNDYWNNNNNFWTSINHYWCCNC